MEKFLISTPLSGEYLTTVRLTVGGLCALAEFDVDSAEDCKVCVTESLLILKRNGFASAKLCFTRGETLGVEIEGETLGESVENDGDDGISYALLNALLGTVEFVKDGDGKVVKIAFCA